MSNFRIHHQLERVFRLRLFRLRRRLTMPRCYLLTSKFLLPSLIALFVYLLVMDIKLYTAVKSRGPLSPVDSNMVRNYTKGIFWPLPVKKIMIGEATHFIRSPLAEIIESSLHFSELFPFITANVVSFTHFILSLICVRFLSSETLLWRQIGVVLFQLRNFLDSFDGVIYRAHAKRANYKSHYGSFGYYVDAVSDVLGGTCLVVSIGLFLLKKRPPNIGLTRCFRLKSEYDDDDDEVVTKVVYDHPGDSYTLLTSKEDTQQISSTSSSQIKSDSLNSYSSRLVASKTTIVVSLILIGARLALSAKFWDRSVHAYEDLVDSVSKSKLHQTLQASVLESNLTLVIMMSWRIMSAIGLMDILLTAIFIDKIWEFIVKTQFISWMALIGLIILTELHLSEIRSILFRVE